MPFTKGNSGNMKVQKIINQNFSFYTNFDAEFYNIEIKHKEKSSENFF